jgi:NAD(P)-dependent dehydrogenase (short-subunit alcohol dehydrogenase family)
MSPAFCGVWDKGGEENIMQIGSGTVAFITGGASGIGFAIAKALSARGAKVMLADLDQGKLDAAVANLTASGGDAAGVVCNVADEAQMRAAAAATIDRFGKVHVVCNNAGVALGGLSGKIAMQDWRWVVDINLMGVVHGVEIFTPLIQSHGEGGHFINVASMAGHVASPSMTPYHATKFAVVGYSEGLKLELVAHNIGVSVLCPAWVKTDIHRSALGKPSQSGSEDDPMFQKMEAVIAAGIDANDVAEWTAKCVEDDRFYIFTHPAFATFIDQRHEVIKADYAAAANYPAFKS